MVAMVMVIGGFGDCTSVVPVRERERMNERERERMRHRQTDRQTDRERERERRICVYIPCPI